MKSQTGHRNSARRRILEAAAGLGLIAALGACSHVDFTHAPPGTSVEVARAKKAQPVPAAVPAAESQHVTHSEHPSGNDTQTENIADYYTLGNLMMQQQKYPEAIKAFENAVKLDPTFSDAWNHLATCYQNSGQEKKAAAAFKKYKSIAVQQPSQASASQ